MAFINDDIILVRNSTFVSNSYLLCNRDNQTCVVIDPGLDAGIMLRTIEDSGLTPIAILSTHGHFDHIGCARDLQERYAVPYYLHEADLKLSQSANFFLKVAGIPHSIKTPKPDILLNATIPVLQLDGFRIGVSHLPGHSPGSCVFQWKQYVFTGDILYKNGLGPESIPKEDKTLLKASIVKLFGLFPEDIIVFPGHGQHDSLGSIKLNNMALKQFLEPKNDAAN